MGQDDRHYPGVVGNEEPEEIMRVMRFREQGILLT